MSALSNFIDLVALRQFGMTRQEAWNKNICIDCKSPIREELGEEETGESGQIYSDAGHKEYRISAMCETCYDNLFSTMGKN